MADSNQEMAEDRTEWAEDRTDWAEDRTVLANERTFSGWMRTGMASLGIAIALQAIFGEFEPTYLARSGASIFVGISMWIFYAAWSNSNKMLKRLDSHTAEPIGSNHITSIAAVFGLGATAVLIILWLV